MSKLFSCAVTAIVLAGLSSPVLAQTAAPASQFPEAANAARFGVAVVDVGYVFKQHAGFLAAMEQMKTDMQGTETELKTDRDRIIAAEEARNRLNPGTPDYKTADEALARMKAEFNLKMTSKQKSFLEREAAVYFSTYSQVSTAVEEYSKRNNIGLVFRFNGDKPNPADREGILKEINKPVVYGNNVDITREILAIVNRGAAAATATRPAAGAIPPR